MTQQALAHALADRAHAGQFDKSGAPYIGHVSRVAMACPDIDAIRAAAWLHDVLEDAPDFAREVRNTFTADVVEAVELLTRRKDVPSADYYAAIRANPIAKAVKIADVKDNSADDRLKLLDEATAARLRKKYAAAMAALTTPDKP